MPDKGKHLALFVRIYREEKAVDRTPAVSQASEVSRFCSPQTLMNAADSGVALAWGEINQRENSH